MNRRQRFRCKRKSVCSWASLVIFLLHFASKKESLRHPSSTQSTQNAFSERRRWNWRRGGEFFFFFCRLCSFLLFWSLPFEHWQRSLQRLNRGLHPEDADVHKHDLRLYVHPKKDTGTRDRDRKDTARQINWNPLNWNPSFLSSSFSLLSLRNSFVSREGRASLPHQIA